MPSRISCLSCRYIATRAIYVSPYLSTGRQFTLYFTTSTEQDGANAARGDRNIHGQYAAIRGQGDHKGRPYNTRLWPCDSRWGGLNLSRKGIDGYDILALCCMVYCCSE